jgi:MraZ protein
LIPSRYHIDAHSIPCYPIFSLIVTSSALLEGSVSHRPERSCAVFRSSLTERVGVGGVDRFVSHFTNRLDAKGRVTIPASFRAVLVRDGFEGLYIHPSLDAEALDCGGHALLQEIDELLMRLSPYSEERDMFSTALLGTSEILKVDPEGRVALSESVKAYAGIGSDVTFVGQGHKFQIWEPGRFRAHLDEARNRVRDLRKQMSSRHAAPDVPSPRPHGARE